MMARGVVVALVLVFEPACSVSADGSPDRWCVPQASSSRAGVGSTPLVSAPVRTRTAPATPQMLSLCGASAVDYLLYASFYTGVMFVPYILHAIFNNAGQSLNQPTQAAPGPALRDELLKKWFKPEKEVPFAPRAARAAAAHKNACENLVVFAPLVLAATRRAFQASSLSPCGAGQALLLLSLHVLGVHVLIVGLSSFLCIFCIEFVSSFLVHFQYFLLGSRLLLLSQYWP